MKQAPLFVDTFSLCQWLLQHLDREPSVLSRNLCETALQLLEAVTLALKGRLREERIEAADERLITLRMQLRLAGATGLLSEPQMLFALECADRIGWQIGGWQQTLNPA
jgi:Mor family transcriptional regulator